jgi:hypothetical protein
MKKFIDFFKKIGILKVGTGDYLTGEYSNNTTKEKKKKTKINGNVNSNIDKNPSAIATTSLWLFWFTLVFGVIILFFSFIIIEFSFWLLFIIGIWICFIIFIKKSIMLGSITLFKTTMFFVLILSINFVFLLLGISNEDTQLTSISINTDKNSKSIKYSSKKTSNSSIDSSICEAENLKEKDNERIKLKIVDSVDVFKDKTKNIYTLKELDNLSYGYSINTTDDIEFVLSEICQGGKTISSADLSKYVSEYGGDTIDGLHYTGGNSTQFNNKQSDGSYVKTIKKPGIYQLYAYFSSNKKNWTIAKKFEFEVVE